jgi:probable HAF family extracellular repeat protein
MANPELSGLPQIQHYKGNQMNVKLFNASLLTACVFLAATSPVNAIGYTFTDLGTLLGGTSSQASAINNSGEIVGSSSTLGNTGKHATLWNGGTITDLSILGDTYSMAADINNAGQIVGYSNNATGGHAILWNGTTQTYLGTLGGNSWANSINNAGQIVGVSSETADDAGHATLWNGTTPTDLNPFWADSSVAVSINDSGQVVGFFRNDSYPWGAVLWNDGTPVDINDNRYFNENYASDINNAGQVVGSGYNPVNADWNGNDAFIWDGTTMEFLGPLEWGSYASAINNTGQVVGYYDINRSPDDDRGFLWSDGVMTELNSLLDTATVNAGWAITYAWDINDNGWIVGQAHNSISNENHAFLLAPVPEPETYALFMAGLGLMGFITRRRKNGQA